MKKPEIGLKTEQLDENAVTSTAIISKKDAAKEFAKLAVPFIGSRFIGAASEFVAAMFLARRGHTFLAASGLITVLNNAVNTTAVVSLYATGALGGAELSAAKKDPTRSKNLGKILYCSYAWALICCAINSIVLYNTKAILETFGQADDVSDIAQDYFRALVVSGGIASTLFSVSSQQVAYVLKKPNLVLLINIVRRIVYLGLAYGMIFGRGGFPELGAAGLAYARAASSWVDVLLFVAYYAMTCEQSTEFGIFRVSVREASQLFGRFVKKALLLAGLTFNEFMVYLVGTFMIGTRSVLGLAASEISTQFSNLCNIPILSIAQAAAIKVSARAKHEPESAKRLGNVAIVCGLLLPLISIPLFSVAGRQLAPAFLHDDGVHTDAILDLAQTLMIFVGCNQLPKMIRGAAIGGFRGYGRYAISMFMSFLAMTVISLPLSYALGFGADVGAPGIYGGYTTGLVIGATAMFLLWNRLPANSAMEPQPLITPTLSDGTSTGSLFKAHAPIPHNGSANHNYQTLASTGQSV